MRDDVLEKAQQLRAEQAIFALATVVLARQPTSGTQGGHAIIFPDGRMEGWVGGHCARPAVIRQSIEALTAGAPRLVVISPDIKEPTSLNGGVVNVPMLCAGQGELQVFVEPFLPRTALVVIGESAVARAIARFAALLDFEVWACDPLADMQNFPDADRLVATLDALSPQLTERNIVVVATIGEYDEDAAQVALESSASYVGLVASNKRLAAVKADLSERGLTEDQIARLKRPAGLKSFVIKPEEIAFSVVAELIEARHQGVGIRINFATQPQRAESIDPICGMTVDVATARYSSVRDGETYYFCCAGCKATFDKQAIS
ncbi:MAG TPA: XdhC family protein [Ktedonobacterales bacterium]|nr:XdhC family protein [Ktedonobacterales bacterium]